MAWGCYRGDHGGGRCQFVRGDACGGQEASKQTLTLPLFTFAPHTIAYDDAARAVTASYRYGDRRGTVLVSITTFTDLTGRRLSPEEAVQMYLEHQALFEHAAMTAHRNGRVSAAGVIVLRKSDLVVKINNLGS